MRPFHILHWAPDPRLHIFNGYNEVIEAVIWGLRALGHEVSYGVNQPRWDAVQILFGAQLMDMATLRRFPDGTIIYNLEQLRGLAAAGRKMDEFHDMADRFVIWDYSTFNIAIWSETFSAAAPRHVPIGFAPLLCRIAKPVDQDIDVLIYGAPSDNRLAVFRALCDLGLSAMFFCGIYREGRDGLIGRSKIVANITSGEHSSIFSIVRVSYLMANRKAVIADIAAVESDITHGVRFAPLPEVAQWCHHYIQHAEVRRTLEENGFRTIERRDIRRILSGALPG